MEAVILLSVDPSLTNSGWAVFRDGTLAKVGHVPTEPRDPLANRVIALANQVTWDRYQVSRLVVEFPRIYPGPQQKGDQNDLLPLAAIAGAMALVIKQVQGWGSPPAEFFHPRQWKGQVPKKVMFARIKKHMTPAELALLDGIADRYVGDVLDAIGLGLWYLGRLGTR